MVDIFEWGYIGNPYDLLHEIPVARCCVRVECRGAASERCGDRANKSAAFDAGFCLETGISDPSMNKYTGTETSLEVHE